MKVFANPSKDRFEFIADAMTLLNTITSGNVTKIRTDKFILQISERIQNIIRETSKPPPSSDVKFLIILRPKLTPLKNDTTDTTPIVVAH